MTYGDGAIFVIDQSSLYRVSPLDGSYETLKGSWGTIRGMSFSGGWLYVVENYSLYKVDPKTGDYEQFPGDWSNSTCMASSS